MKKSNILFIGLLLASVIAFYFFKTNDKEIIAKRLNTLTTLASVNNIEAPLLNMSKARKIADYFSQMVHLEFSEDEVEFKLDSKKELLSSVLAARSKLEEMKIELFETKIQVTGDQAMVFTKARARGKIPSQEFFSEVRMFQVELFKIEGKWLITSVFNIVE